MLLTAPPEVGGILLTKIFRVVRNRQARPIHVLQLVHDIANALHDACLQPLLAEFRIKVGCEVAELMVASENFLAGLISDTPAARVISLLMSFVGGAEVFSNVTMNQFLECPRWEDFNIGGGQCVQFPKKLKRLAVL